jgi:hypothetical protein
MVVSSLARTDPAKAKAELEQNKDALAPGEYYKLEGEIKDHGDSIAANKFVNRMLGVTPNTSPTAPGPPQLIGGAVPKRISEAADTLGFDRDTALAAASIESRMGQNTGGPGRAHTGVFQLGKEERASVGGGDDIRAGVAFLKNKKSEMAMALGREPTPAEIYLAHQQGTHGALSLLSNPNTPAGKLVGEAAISQNGGNPNAPASTFVAKWEKEFNRRLAQVKGDSGAPVDNMTAVGDSIAAHLVRKAGVNGREYNFERRDDSTAVSGYGPTQIQDVIDKMPDEDVKGRNVVLSSGVSNNPAQIDQVARQIQTLKARGAATVTVLGVGNHPKLAGVNDQLSTIAQENGAAFAGPLAKVADDGIHSKSPPAVLDQARVAKQPAGAISSIGVPSPAAPVNRTGLPPLYEMLKQIDASDLTDTQKEKAVNNAKTKYWCARG